MENKAYSGQMIVEFLIALTAVLSLLTFFTFSHPHEQMEKLIEAHELKKIAV